MKTRRGICSICHQDRSLGRGKKCQSCRTRSGPCKSCGHIRKLYSCGQCCICREDERVREALLEFESRVAIPFEYNRYLWGLYLIYIRRNRLRYGHLCQARRLSQILLDEAWEPISSWMQIYRLASLHPLYHRKSGFKKGCALTKIGHMLQELGVLGPRGDEVGRQLEGLLSGFSPTTRAIAQDFVETLVQAGRARLTAQKYLYFLRLFEKWFKADTQNESTDLLGAQSVHVKKFLAQILTRPSSPDGKVGEKTLRPKYLHEAYCSLDRFCVEKRKTLSNPCKNVQVSRPPIRIHVCSPEQVRKLVAYVRNPASNPEYALLITLILFFGLTAEDLSFAQLGPGPDRLSLILRRKPRTHGRRFYHRTQCLELPESPAWLARLQKHFLADWRLRYAQVKSTYPHFSLVLHRAGHANRPLSTDCIRERLEEATIAAVGVAIPTRVLRQTCGHLHTRNQDASPLTRLGWSPFFTYYYTWMPRTYFTPEPSSHT